MVADYGFAKILHIAPTSYLALVDGTKGMHTTDEPKSVALALITDQLDEWYTYLETQDVEMKYGYDPVGGRPHHGFVILDPEGYYLEFERFNEHPEDEQLMPILDQAQTILVDPDPQTAAPAGLGFKSTVHEDGPRVQGFVGWRPPSSHYSLEHRLHEQIAPDESCEHSVMRACLLVETGARGLVILIIKGSCGLAFGSAILAEPNHDTLGKRDERAQQGARGNSVCKSERKAHVIPGAVDFYTCRNRYVLNLAVA